jgi:flagellar hook protein FlgE
MSLFGGIRSAVSGLFAQSQALGQIADNIANVNTTGFKAIRPRFSTLVTTQSSINLHSPGGVQSSVLREIDQPGLLEASSSATDIAIGGNGFFVVNATAAGTGDFSFTRAGSFRPDKDGNLINAGGFFLFGFPITAGIVQPTNILTQLEVVNIASAAAAPIATSTIDIGANLQSSAATNATFDLAVGVLDKQGAPDQLTFTFTKLAAANTWQVSSTLATRSFINAANNAILNPTGVLGQVTFNADGTLRATNLTGATMNTALTATADGFTFDVDHDNNFATVAGAGATADRVNITLDLGTVNTTVGLTQFEGAFTPNFVNTNGKQFGSLTGVSIAADGVVAALFDNGETRNLNQIPLVTFANANGLIEQSGNVYQETTRSGTATIKTANTGGAGVVAPSALEASTVDIADEFTRMIITQRAFSANTKVITTGDEMLDELVRIVR